LGPTSQEEEKEEQKELDDNKLLFLLSKVNPTLLYKEPVIF
jgi:hypothetical protein